MSRFVICRGSYMANAAPSAPRAFCRHGTGILSTQIPSFRLDFAYHRVVRRYSFTQASALETIVRPWLQARDTEVAELNGKLPGKKILSDSQRAIIAAKPMTRLVKVRYFLSSARWVRFGPGFHRPHSQSRRSCV